MEQLETAYRRGVAKGQLAAQKGEVSPQWIVSLMDGMRAGYPRAAELDIWAEILRLDHERIENPPDYTKFPEARGWPDLIRREREGFLEGAGCDERARAFFYNRGFFGSRRLNTRYAGSSPANLRAGHCTAVYIRDTAEGGPLFGRTLDDVRMGPDIEAAFLVVPDSRTNWIEMTADEGNRPWLLKSLVSGAVLGDEEPREIFPLNAWDVMPADCNSIADMVAFLERYADFWGPHCGLLVDRDGDAIAFEKSNCRLGVRYSENGAAASTACSYLIPEMAAHKQECGRGVLAQDAPDWEYWQGCDARHRRLLQLTAAANLRGATLEDMSAIVTDHAVPFPDKICLEGETGVPGDKTGNWTWTAKASVLSGPNSRTLLWRMDGDKPAHSNPPVLIPAHASVELTS